MADVSYKELVEEAEREFRDEGLPPLGSYSCDTHTYKGHIQLFCHDRIVGVLRRDDEGMYSVAWPERDRLGRYRWPRESIQNAYTFLLGYWEGRWYEGGERSGSDSEEELVADEPLPVPIMT